jgi:type I restriction enzyme R subunit
MEAAHGQRPLIYYTNGFEHWYWDDTRHPPRQVEGFHSQDGLLLAVQRRSTLRRLAETVINPAIVDRSYQLRAVRRIAESFERLA